MSEELVGETPEEAIVEAPESTEASAEPKSMDDTLRETLATIEAREAPEETPEQKAGRTANRLRDEKGRLLPGVKDAAPQETKPEETVISEPTPAVEPVAAAPVPPEVQRLGLRKEEAAAFAAAPEVLKNALIRRSEEMHKGLEPLRQKAQAAENYERALQPFMQTIQQSGLPAHEAVNRLFAGEHGLRYGSDDQKAVHALNMIKSYGIDVNRLFQIASGQYQPQVQPVQQPVAQPNITELVNAEVEKRFLQQEIDRFASDPQYKHFETLKPLMGSLLDSGAATSLSDAYEQALRAHPTLGQEWITQQLSAAEEKRKQEAAQRAQAAKQAAAVNISRKGTTPAKRPIGTMEETIRATAERLGVI